MANLKALKERIAGMNGTGGGSKGNRPNLRWSPTDEHDIRVVPYGDPLNDSILEVVFHYNLGETRSLLCPESPDVKADHKCIINKYASALWSKWDDEGKQKSKARKDADYEVYKRIKPQTRFAMRVIERGKESEGVKWWCFSQDVLDQIVKICDTSLFKKVCGLPKDQDTGYAVLVSLDNAFDLHVSSQKAKNADGKGNTTDFNKTVVQVEADEPSPLAKSKKEVEKILASVTPFTDAYPLKTEDEIEKVLDLFMKSTFSKEADAESPGVEYATNSTEDASKVGERLVKDAVEDLLNA